MEKVNLIAKYMGRECRVVLIDLDKGSAVIEKPCSNTIYVNAKPPTIRRRVALKNLTIEGV